MLWHIRAFVAAADSAEDTHLRVKGGEAATFHTACMDRLWGLYPSRALADRPARPLASAKRAIAAGAAAGRA
jgi:hypothetical protein